MLKQLKSFEEMVGKTVVASADVDDSLIIRFGCGAFIVLNAIDSCECMCAPWIETELAELARLKAKYGEE